MKRVYLDYFKSLFEGTAEISWNAWFRAHEAELKAEMKRAAFLRLKFHKLEEAEKYLREANVAYRKDPVAYKRETRYSLMHESVLDEKGRPLESFQRRAYDGAYGKLMDGDIEAGREMLKNFIQKVRRLPDERRQEELEALCFDGEMELELGDPAIARVLLEAVYSYSPKGIGLTEFAVQEAQSLLLRMDAETSRTARFPVLVRLRHDKPAEVVLPGADGLLVTSTRDGLFLWEIETGKSIVSIRDFDEGAHQAVMVLDLSPDGKYLCTGTADLTTKVYSTETGERLARLSKVRPDFYNSAEQICFSSDGRILATSMGKKIELFSVGEWEKINELKGHTSKAHLLISVPGASMLVSAAGKYVIFWDLEAGEELLTLPAFNRKLGTLAVSADGSMLGTSTEGGEVSLWSLPGGELLKTYTEHESEVFGLAISPDNSLIASSELNGFFHLWKAEDGQTIKRLTPGYGDPVFSPDNKLLAIVSNEQTWIIRAADGMLLDNLGHSFDLSFLDDQRIVCGDGNDVVVREIQLSKNELAVDSDEVSKTIIATQKKSDKAKTQRKQARKSQGKDEPPKASSTHSHFWLNVRRELKTVRLFHSKPDLKAVRPEFQDLACDECHKVDQLSALERGVAEGVKPPPEDIQLALTDDGILVVSPTVREVLEQLAPDDLRYFDFPDSPASIVWPRHILSISPDAELRSGSKDQTTVLAFSSPRCRTCGRPRGCTVRPSRGKYTEEQKIIGLALEPGFWFVVHQSVGDALKAAKVTGWRREELGSSKYI